jgi:hypothetical protein
MKIDGRNSARCGKGNSGRRSAEAERMRLIGRARYQLHRCCESLWDKDKESVTSLPTIVSGSRHLHFLIAAGPTSRIKTEELGRLISAADVEWQGIIMFGRYTGLPLLECASLLFKYLQGNCSLLSLPVPIIAQPIKIPLGPKLIGYLRQLHIAAGRGSPLFPRCSQLSLRALEKEFESLAASARITEPRTFSSLYVEIKGASEPI